MISKNKNQVIEAVKRAASLKATRIRKIKEQSISYMEKLLVT
jgi:hypothetical protein